jgi:hypothetical protein
MNETLKKATLGLLGIFAVFLALFIFKHDLLTSDSSLKKFSTVSVHVKQAQYIPLEPTTIAGLGVTTPSFNGMEVSFFSTRAFLYTLLFVGATGVTSLFLGFAMFAFCANAKKSHKTEEQPK